MSVGRKTVLGVIAVLVILTAGAYGLGFWYFSSHFLPGTVIGEMDCSLKTVEEAGELLAAKAGSYVLAVETRHNGVESITAQEAGLTYRPDGLLNLYLKEQGPAGWFLKFGKNENL